MSMHQQCGGSCACACRRLCLAHSRSCVGCLVLSSFLPPTTSFTLSQFFTSQSFQTTSQNPSGTRARATLVSTIFDNTLLFCQIEHRPSAIRSTRTSFLWSAQGQHTTDSTNTTYANPRFEPPDTDSKFFVADIIQFLLSHLRCRILKKTPESFFLSSSANQHQTLLSTRSAVCPLH